MASAAAVDGDVYPLINIKELVEELYHDTKVYLDDENDDKGEKPFLEIAAEKMSVTAEMIAELDSVCGLSALTCEGELSTPFTEKQTKEWSKIPESTSLMTLSAQKQHIARRSSNSNYRVYSMKRLKYKRKGGPWVHEVKRRLSPEHQMENLPEALISVQVFCPFFFKQKLWLSQEMHVLGRQTLDKLRDTIKCLADSVVVGEYSDHPDLPQDVTTKDLYKSGFFYIEGVFYNDMRDPSCHDYSRPIREWAKRESRRNLGPFRTAVMETTRFDSLSVRLGYPYVYQHQGNCEHLIIFSDIRLLHPEDCQKEDEYPLITNEVNPRRIKCRICLANTAVWMTEDSPLAPEDPCYFCDTCFRMLHYDAEGNKVGDFKAYPYCSSPGQGP